MRGDFSHLLATTYNGDRCLLRSLGTFDRVELESYVDAGFFLQCAFQLRTSFSRFTESSTGIVAFRKPNDQTIWRGICTGKVNAFGLESLVDDEAVQPGDGGLPNL